MDIDEIEWHDLPLTSIRINEDSIELVVTPIDEATRDYRNVSLTISDAERIDVQIVSEMSRQDFRNLEVATFDWERDLAGRVSGTIGILPANCGYWTISFKLASCVLNAAPRADHAVGAGE